MAMYAISHDVGDKEAYCKRRATEITSEMADSLQNDISEEIKNLNKTIYKRKKDLDQEIASANISEQKTTLSLSPDFYSALDKLDFSFGDFGNMILAGISGVGAYFALANFWNPLGWIAAAATFVVWLLGGRDKEAEAKEEMRKNINKAKADNRSSFNAQISKIIENLDSRCNNITKSVDKDRLNLNKLRNYIQSAIQSIKTEYSKSIAKQFKNEARIIIGDNLLFPEKPSGNDMVVKLCEPREKEQPQTHYTQSLERLSHSGNALQHIIISGNEKDDAIDKASARRILIELLVKDSLVKGNIPLQLTGLIQKWAYYRYKINNGTVHGASFSVNAKGDIAIQEYGMGQNRLGEDFESFVQNNLNYYDCDKIRGARDYMAMKKNGNVYLIIDTDEIPILDVSQINDAYDDVVNRGETIALFKRKSNNEAHKYLRGYIGFHLWKSDGIDGEINGSYSYISGTNSENMQITQGTKMDKMPRARRIFILHREHPSTIEKEIMEIVEMLKFGFGRWNELMTYPFPFKFLQEYLDNVCETVFSKHWKEITYRGEL